MESRGFGKFNVPENQGVITPIEDPVVVLAVEGRDEDGEVWTRDMVQNLEGIEVATVLPDFRRKVQVREVDGKLQAVVIGMALIDQLRS